MSAARLIVVGGGVRSGKSAFALGRARALGSRRVFIATAQAFDAEMRARIAAHVVERGDAFVTLEAPLELAACLVSRSVAQADVVVVDCLTLWLSNCLLREPAPTDAQLEQQLSELVSLLRVREQHVVLVTNEVGMGVVPESALGRRFRDQAGRAHQQLCAIADEIYLAVLGCIVRLRPEPLALEPVVPPPSAAGEPR